MSDDTKFSLIKPTLNTTFHIDFDWWKNHDNNWRVHLYSCLCEEHQHSFSGAEEECCVDWVDPVTAEVLKVDGLQQVLITHCARLPEFITLQTTLVESVFRTLLANGNIPMNSIQLAETTGKSANTILQTLTGVRVYKGIRPVVS